MTLPTTSPDTIDEPVDSWTRLKDVVADALELPATERLKLLETTVGDDPDLFAQAVELIDAADEDAAMLDPRTDAFIGLSGPDTAALDGRRIGKFTLVRLLGEGAMASVYLAKQDDVGRPVALKVFRPHALGHDALLRFRREVDALGRIEHPFVARIFEADIHYDIDLPGKRGLPYIAMEYVDGLPVTQFAEAHKLEPEQRIALIADIADAVHAAHQRAIVHRDLKPGNVLVIPDNDHGTPKVLDFGIARVVEEVDPTATNAAAKADRAHTLHTTTGVLLGTLGYMAPEQARGQTELIDTRADVFAIGVMLHELLVGARPVDTNNLPLTEVLRRLSDPQIPNPTDIRGDWKTILQTALDPDPARRYPSAEALADDLRRSLRHEPITARPPTRMYLVRKFVRRNRVPVAAAAAVTVTLLAGTVASTLAFVREADARATAELAFTGEAEARAEAERALGREAIARTEAEQALAREAVARSEAEEALVREADARVEAELAAARSVRTSEFLSTMLSSADPGEMGKDVTVRDMIAAAEPSIAGEFKDEPLVESSLRLALAQTFSALGEIDKAHAQYARHVELLDIEPEIMAIARVAVVAEWSSMLVNHGRIEEGAQLLDQSTAIAATLDPMNIARIMHDEAVANLLLTIGDYDAALPLYADVYERAGRSDDAENFDTMANNYAIALTYVGDYETAAQISQVSMDARRVRLGPDHPETMLAAINHAQVLSVTDPIAAAELVNGLIPKMIEQLGPMHPTSIGARRMRGELLAASGEVEAGAEVLGELLAELPDDAGTVRLSVQNSLATALNDLGRYDEAVSHYRAATSAMQSMFGPEHPDTLIGRANLATALGNAGDYEGARTELKDILAVQQELLGAGNVNALITMNNLAMVNLELGRLDEAEDLLRTFVVGIEEVGAPVNVTFGRRNLGRVLTAAGKFEQAEIELTEAFTGTQQLLGPAQQAKSAGYLAELYEAWNKPDEAERWRTVEAELQ